MKLTFIACYFLMRMEYNTISYLQFFSELYHIWRKIAITSLQVFELYSRSHWTVSQESINIWIISKDGWISLLSFLIRAKTRKSS